MDKSLIEAYLQTIKEIFLFENIVLITGSTDGIGYQTAIELVKLGSHIFQNIIFYRETVRELNTNLKVSIY